MRILRWFISGVLVCAPALLGQAVVSTHAGIVEFAGGRVSIDGVPVEPSRVKFPEIREGQTLRTDNGRVEILLGPGVFLRMLSHGAVRMVKTDLDDARVEVLEGTALVEVIEQGKGLGVQILVGSTGTAFRSTGLYRFDAGPRELRVFGGRAAVVSGPQVMEASRGKVIRLGPGLLQTTFDPKRETANGVRPEKDQLHQWSARRSYRLFNANRASGSRQLNWEVRRVSPGDPGEKGSLPSDLDRFYIMNRDFGVTFYVPPRRNGR